MNEFGIDIENVERYRHFKPKCMAWMDIFRFCQLAQNIWTIGWIYYSEWKISRLVNLVENSSQFWKSPSKINQSHGLNVRPMRSIWFGVICTMETTCNIRLYLHLRTTNYCIFTNGWLWNSAMRYVWALTLSRLRLAKKCQTLFFYWRRWLMDSLSTFCEQLYNIPITMHVFRIVQKIREIDSLGTWEWLLQIIKARQKIENWKILPFSSLVLIFSTLGLVLPNNLIIALSFLQCIYQRATIKNESCKSRVEFLFNNDLIWRILHLCSAMCNWYCICRRTHDAPFSHISVFDCVKWFVVALGVKLPLTN